MALDKREQGISRFNDQQPLERWFRTGSTESLVVMAANEVTDERRPPLPLPNVRLASGFFERMRGVRTAPTAFGREVKLTRCNFPSYFVDGQQMQVDRIDDMFLVDDIEAIEVYDGVTRVPLEFNRPPLGAINSGSSCGAIVIWTRSP